MGHVYPGQAWHWWAGKGPMSPKRIRKRKWAEGDSGKGRPGEGSNMKRNSSEQNV